MSSLIQPGDPNLPAIWQKLPCYSYEIATLSRDKPQNWKPSVGYGLEHLFPGWHVSHGFQSGSDDPFQNSLTPEDTEQILAQLETRKVSIREKILDELRSKLRHTDFRKAEGLARLFAGHSPGFLTPEQRENLLHQIETEPSLKSDPTLLRQAFIELEGGFAVGAGLWCALEYPYYPSKFESDINPVLTLLGREVVLSEDWQTDSPKAKGILELEGNTLKISHWKKDFSRAEVMGTPFEEAEVELLDDESVAYIFTDAKVFDERYKEES